MNIFKISLISTILYLNTAFIFTSNNEQILNPIPNYASDLIHEATAHEHRSQQQALDQDNYMPTHLILTTPNKPETYHNQILSSKKISFFLTTTNIIAFGGLLFAYFNNKQKNEIFAVKEKDYKNIIENNPEYLKTLQEKTKFEELQSQNLSLDNQNKTLALSIKQAENEKNRLQLEIEKQKSGSLILEAIEKNEAKWKVIKSELNYEINQKKEAIKQLEKTIRDLNNITMHDYNQLQYSHSNLKAKIYNLESSINTLTIQISQKESSIYQLESQIKNLKNQLSLQNNSSNYNLTQQIKNLESNIRVLEGRISQKDNQIKQLEKENSNLKYQNNSSFKKEKQDLLSQIEVNNKTIQSLKDELAYSNDLVKRLRDALAQAYYGKQNGPGMNE